MDSNSVNTETTPDQIQNVLKEVQILDENLPGPLTLNDSITELEDTMELSKRLEADG